MWSYGDHVAASPAELGPVDHRAVRPPVIDPPRRDQPYPGRLPPVARQWTRLPVRLRAGLIAGPLLVILVVLLVDVAAGVGVAVMLGGAAAATITYVKNRSDRHNAAVDRGEMTLPDAPLLRPASVDDVPPDLLLRLAQLGYPGPEVARVVRFDGGWLVARRDPRAVAVVIGDDGGWARFEPRWVPDLWAACEYLAGRGREPA